MQQESLRLICLAKKHTKSSEQDQQDVDESSKGEQEKQGVQGNGNGKNGEIELRANRLEHKTKCNTLFRNRNNVVCVKV